MAFADGNIIIGTSVDVGGIDTGLHKIQKQFRKLGRLAFATIGVKAFAKLGKAAIDAASDLQEIQNVVDVAFKDTSYKIEEFSKVCIQYFGMSEIAAKKTAGSFMAMATSIGITKEAASDMAVELTGLSGDFASFYNISQEYAKVAMSAVFTGETETVKRYGIIMTEANLQEYALTEGIQKKVKAMNAEEKALLRYNYLMSVTKNMHHDFERTQNNWANSVRVLKEQWTQFMTLLGQGFIHALQPVIQVINILIGKLIAVFKYLNALLGITSQLDDVTFSDELEEEAEAVDELGNAIKHQLAPFDKLNNLTSSTKSGVDDDTTDLEKLYAQMKLSGYVIDAMKDFEVKLQEVSDATKEKLKNIVNRFRRAKFKIEQIWQDVKLGNWFSAGKGFGDLITSLNQFISDAIAGVDWQKKGEEVADFFRGIIWSDALGGVTDTLISALNAVVSFAVGGINKITISDVIQFAKNVSKAARKFFKWIYDTLKRVDWKGLGKKIGTFISNIDWGGVFKDTIAILFEALKAAINAFDGIFDAAPLVAKIGLGVVAAFKVAQFTGLTAALNKSFGKAVTDWRKGWLNEDGKLVTTSPVGKAFTAGLGAISFSLGVMIIGDTIMDMKMGEIDSSSMEGLFKNFLGSLLTVLGTTMVLGAFGLKLGAEGFIITTAATFLATTVLGFIFEASDDEKMQKAKRELKEKLDAIDWVHELSTTVDVLLSLDVDYETKIGKIEGDLDYYTEMAEKWKEMSEAYNNLSEKDKALVQLYGEQLGTKFSELKPYIDSVTGAYNGTAEAIQAVIDKTRDLMIVQALQKEQEETATTIGRAKVQKREAEQELAAWQKNFDDNLDNIVDTIYKDIKKWGGNSEEFYEWLFEFYGDEKGYKKYIEKQLKAGYTEFDSWGGRTYKFSNWQFDWSDNEALNNVYDFANASEQLALNIIDLDNAIASAYKTMDTYEEIISEMQYELTNANFKTVLEGLGQAFKTTFEGVDEKWGTDVQAAIDAIKLKLENDEDISTDVANLYTLLNGGLAALPEGEMPEDVKQTINNINAALAEGKITAKQAMTLLGEAMLEGFTDGFGDNKLGTGFFKVASAATSELDYFEEKLKDPEFKKAVDEARKTIQDAITASADTKGRSKKSGKEIQDSVVDGMTTITPENNRKLDSNSALLSNRLISGIEEPLEINSPSKVMRDEVAGGVIEGLVDGLNNGISAIIGAASAVVNALVNTFDAVHLSPTLTIVPKIDMANVQIPDIVNGMTVPVSVTTSSNTTTVGAMTKKELSDLLTTALSNMKLTGTLEAEPDEQSFFKSIKAQAKIFKERTGNAAFT